MSYLKLGTILKTRGLKGQVKVFSTSDFSQIRYKKGKKVYILNPLDEKETKEVEVLDYSSDGQFDYVTFKGYENIDAVTPFLKKDIAIIKEEHPLENGYYYHDDLERCAVYSNNELIGYVKNIEDFNGRKSLRITLNNEKEFLLPFIDVFVKSINIEEKRIDVELIKGMLE